MPLLFDADDGIVVVEVRRDAGMRLDHVSPSLQERLGADATDGLLELLEAVRDEWGAQVTTLVAERFDRRLGDELGKLRLEMREGLGTLRVELRQEIAAGDAQLRDEMRNSTAALRDEMRNSTAALREDVRNQFAGLRVEITSALAKLEVDLTRRTFGMWIGQLVAIAAILSVMFQLYAR